MLEKKILILANNPLSDTNSNGRTLKNFFAPEDREKLSQMYIHGDAPDFSACARFFRVSDGAVLRSFLKRAEAGCVVSENEVSELRHASSSAKKMAKSPFRLLVRNFLWNRQCWRKQLYAWIDDIVPEVVLLQAGDSPFMYRLAVSIAKDRGIPLLIYNSEDYYFQKHSYMRLRGLASLFYPCFRRKLRRAVQAALAYASCSVYISEDLQSAYDAEFHRPSTYIYTATAMIPAVGNKTEGIFSYLGNFGYDRHKALIQIAEALARISPEYRLDVYGKLPNEEVAMAFAACPAICYRGLVDYDTVCRVMQESTLLFHAECFDETFRAAVRHGFSTKIADSLASGSCFVIYAPPELSCTKYLKENACACVIDDEGALEGKLRELIESPMLRCVYIERAMAVVAQNHNAEKNRKRMAEIINSLQ